MTYKTILVHVDAGKRCATRVGIAARLARQFDAHLVGLNALTRYAIPAYAVAGTAGMIEDLQQRAAAEQRAQAEAMFRRASATENLRGVEWRDSDADAVEAVALHARYADLVIIGQPEAGDDSGVEENFAASAVLAAGRPVLMVPYAGEFRRLATRVLVAWDARRESTRALTDALPLLRAASKVHIITFDARGDGHGEVPGADIGLYLSRHGVAVEVRIDQSADIDVGNALLSRAADLDCDLLVMGGYGHSRLQQLVMGGVTRTLLESMTLPVLMSH